MEDNQDPPPSEGSPLTDEAGDVDPSVLKEEQLTQAETVTNNQTDEKEHVQPLDSQFQKKETILLKEIAQKDQEISELTTELQDQKETIITLDAQLTERQNTTDTQVQELSGKNSELKAQLIASQKLFTETNQELQHLQKQHQLTQTIINDKNQIINEYIQALHGAKEEQQTYLTQIAKFQDLIQQTEVEIEEIEAGHQEILGQMQAEVKRAEGRAGQLERADPSKSSLARDKHIRTILQESEVGKIVLFLMDYFEKKSRTLDLRTLSTELGISPIIARKHLRYLHELGICVLNEARSEIRLVT